MFGKRKRKTPPPQQRIIPETAWEGKTGEFLNKIGMSPDDPSNLMPNKDSIQFKLNEAQKAETAFVQKINSQLPENAKVVPFSLVPIQCWQAEQNTKFLYYILEILPFGSWNLILLPENDMGELILNLPKHPRAWPKEIVDIANNNIRQMEAKYMATYQEVAAAMANNDSSKLELMAKAKVEALTALETMGVLFATKLLGNDPFIRSKEMFFGENHWRQMLGG